MSLAEGWGFRIARRVPATMPPSAAGTQRADRDGVSGIPRSGRHRGAADPLGKTKPSRSGKKKQAPSPWGKRESGHPPGGLNFPLPMCSGAGPKGQGSTMAERLLHVPGTREGGGELRPAGGRSHCAGACGHRAGVPRWGIAGVVSYEQRGAPTRDVPARSHAQAGRRAGLDAQPERPLKARGARKKPRSGRKTEAFQSPGKERAITQ